MLGIAWFAPVCGSSRKRPLGTRLSADEREELKRLRKEVRLLWREKEILKNQPVLREGNAVKYGFIPVNDPLADSEKGVNSVYTLYVIVQAGSPIENQARNPVR